MPPTPHLLALATAVPPFAFHQAEVATLAQKVFSARESEIQRLLTVFENAGIETRYSCVPLEWYAHPHGWVERNRLYIENAVALLERAAISCLADTGLRAEDVDGIVAVSTTGLATPSIDALLVERLGMRRNVWRLPVFGLGCAGGVLGLARAGALAKASPDQRILLLVVELCGLTFRPIDQSKSNIIATALFGDGAAAAVVSCRGDGPAITNWGEVMWPNSLDVMGWRIEEDGFGVLFSRDIPALVRADYLAVTNDFLDSCSLSIADIAAFVCHPGGAKVVDALESAFGLCPGGLSHARAVLRRYGNMSAASVMFVLERVQGEGVKGNYLLSTLGPGFTAGFLTMKA